METIKKIGIWMDHASANLMELTTGTMGTETIESAFTHEEKEESLGKSENLMHNKEQHMQAAYFRKISNAIKDYDEVLLFGPTDAKAQLYNILKADSHFVDTKITIQQTSRMTANQQHAFVKEYFAKSPIY